MDQGLLQQLDANYQAQRRQTPTIAKPKRDKGGAKGLLTALLPLAGGALGGLAGVVGGPAGIIAGGAAGAAGGEALKQKLQGGPIDRGDIVEQGVLGALPGVGSAFKAIRAGGTAASLLGRGAETAATERAATASPGLATKLYNKGVMTEARSGGFGQGEKVTGGESLGFRDSQKISKSLADEGITGANASARQIAVGDRLANHSRTIDSAVAAKNVEVPEDQLVNILDRVQGRILGSNGKGVTGFQVGNKAQVDIAKSYARQLSGVKDARGLLDFKRSLDADAINYGRNSMSPDPVKEQIAKAFRQEVNKDFGDLVPEAKAASTAYSKLHDANEFLKQAARDQSNAATQGGASGLVSRFLTSDAANTAKSKVGLGLQKVGGALGAETGMATPGTVSANSLFSGGNLAKAGMQQAGSRALVQPLIGNDPTAGQQPADGTTDISSFMPDGMGASAGLGLDANQQAAPESAYSNEAFMADVARDPKNASTYMSLFKTMNDAAKAEAKNASGGPNITKVTAQQYGLAQSGQGALQQLASMIEQNPGIVTKTATPGRQLPIIGGFISNKAGTGQYDAIGYNIADSLLRLRTGATANEAEVKNLQAQIMPRAGDSPETIRTKLAQLEQVFGAVIKTANSGAGGGTDTSLQTTDGAEVY
jgi:hypothetical protein